MAGGAPAERRELTAAASSDSLPGSTDECLPKATKVISHDFEEQSKNGLKKKRRKTRLLILFEDDEEKTRWWPWVVVLLVLALAIAGVVVLITKLEPANSTSVPPVPSRFDGPIEIRPLDVQGSCQQLLDAAAAPTVLGWCRVDSDGAQTDPLHEPEPVPFPLSSRWQHATPEVQQEDTAAGNSGRSTGRTTLGMFARQQDIVTAPTRTSRLRYAVSGTELIALMPEGSAPAGVPGMGVNATAVQSRFNLLEIMKPVLAALESGPKNLTEQAVYMAPGNSADACPESARQEEKIGLGLRATFRADRVAHMSHRELVVLGHAIDSAPDPRGSPLIDLCHGGRCNYHHATNRPMYTSVALFLNVVDPRAPAVSSMIQIEGSIEAAQQAVGRNWLFVRQAAVNPSQHQGSEPQSGSRAAEPAHPPYLPLWRAWEPLAEGDDPLAEGDPVRVPVWQPVQQTCQNVRQFESGAGARSYGGSQGRLLTVFSVPVSVTRGSRASEMRAESMILGWSPQVAGLLVAGRKVFLAETLRRSMSLSEASAPAVSSGSAAGSVVTALAEYHLLPEGGLEEVNVTSQSGELLFQGALSYDEDTEQLRVLTHVDGESKISDFSILRIYTASLTLFYYSDRLFVDQKATAVQYEAARPGSSFHAAVPLLRDSSLKVLEVGAARNPDTASDDGSTGVPTAQVSQQAFVIGAAQGIALQEKTNFVHLLNDTRSSGLEEVAETVLISIGDRARPVETGADEVSPMALKISTYLLESKKLVRSHLAAHVDDANEEIRSEAFYDSRAASVLELNRGSERLVANASQVAVVALPVAVPLNVTSVTGGDQKQVLFNGVLVWKVVDSEVCSVGALPVRDISDQSCSAWDIKRTDFWVADGNGDVYLTAMGACNVIVAQLVRAELLTPCPERTEDAVEGVPVFNLLNSVSNETLFQGTAGLDCSCGT